MENYNRDQQFSSYTVIGSSVRPASKTFIASVFMWMFIALGISAFFAFLFVSNHSLFEAVFATPVKWLIIFAPIAFIMIIGRRYERMSVSSLTAMFAVFAILMGISLSGFVYSYTKASVLSCFASGSAMFGIMALMGYTTDKDLTSFGRIMTMGLIGIIIASLINLFIGSSQMNFIISIIGVAVFTGLTAYDVQKLKRIGAGMEFEGISANDTKKVSILGAMTLYLDFVNLFIMLLSIFGVSGRKKS